MNDERQKIIQSVPGCGFFTVNLLLLKSNPFWVEETTMNLF